jgi:hypothetical protein
MNADPKTLFTAASAVNELRPILRMPAQLGPAAGPRNMPRSKAHQRFDGEVLTVTVTALGDADALTRILPPRCRLAGEPLFDVSVVQQTNLGWLAGRGYNIVAVRMPVICATKAGDVTLSYTAVLWENMADPVLTGREELGAPKLFANISNPLPRGEGFACSAEWDGFRFMDLEVTDLQAATAPPPPGLPQLFFRYFARVGDWENASVAELTRANKGAAPTPVLREHRVGRGRFSFRHARWEDMPTQYTYINTLAELPVREFRGARVTRVSGILDIAAQTVIE